MKYSQRHELLPLPGDLQKSRDESKQQLAEMTKHAAAETRRADDLAREVAELKARLKNGKNGKH